MSDDEWVVGPVGELDIGNVPELRDEWIRTVERLQPARFVIDLSGVTYLDSTALGAIVAVKNRQREHGGDLIVTHARPRIAKIFQMTGLGAVIDGRHTTEPGWPGDGSQIAGD